MVVNFRTLFASFMFTRRQRADINSNHTHPNRIWLHWESLLNIQSKCVYYYGGRDRTQNPSLIVLFAEEHFWYEMSKILFNVEIVSNRGMDGYCCWHHNAGWFIRKLSSLLTCVVCTENRRFLSFARITGFDIRKTPAVSCVHKLAFRWGGDVR